MLGGFALQADRCRDVAVHAGHVARPFKDLFRVALAHLIKLFITTYVQHAPSLPQIAILRISFERIQA